MRGKKGPKFKINRTDKKGKVGTIITLDVCMTGFQACDYEYEVVMVSEIESQRPIAA